MVDSVILVAFCEPVFGSGRGLAELQALFHAVAGRKAQ